MLWLRNKINKFQLRTLEACIPIKSQAPCNLDGGGPMVARFYMLTEMGLDANIALMYIVL